MEAIKKVLEEIIRRVSYVEKLFAIKRVGSITIAGFIAEVGDIRRFDSPKQIQKYAGLELGGKQFGKAQRKDEDQQTWEKKTQKDPVSGNGTAACKKQGVPRDL